MLQLILKTNCLYRLFDCESERRKRDKKKMNKGNSEGVLETVKNERREEK